jgi:hypothetical protein
MAFLALPLVCLLAYSMGISRPDIWGDSLYNASGHIESLVVILGPLAAGVSAWEAGRFRRTGFDSLSSSMPRTTVQVGSLDVVAVATLFSVAYVVGAVAAVSRTVGSGPLALGVILLGLVGIIAFSALGYALGVWGPKLATAPVVTLGAYVLLVFVPQWKPDWLARLSILDATCCSINVRVRPSALAGQFLLLGAMVLVACALTVARRGRPLTVAVWAAAAVLVAAASGALLVQGGGALTVARQTPEMPACAIGAHATVCLWPEHRYALADASAAADIALEPFQKLPGTPTRLNEAGLVASDGDAGLAIGIPGAGTTLAAYATDIVQELLPPPPACSQHDGEYAPYPGASARVYIRAWLIMQVDHHVRVQDLGPGSSPWEWCSASA